MENEVAVKDLEVPTVFKGRIEDWPCRKWTLNTWAEKFGSLSLKFRVGSHQSQQGPTWEGDCEYLDSSLNDFVKWQSAECKDDERGKLAATKLARCDPKLSWVYADYKHLAHLFDNDHEIIQSIDWGAFGVKGCSGEKSTIWIGSSGANTPCHFDTYGFNLVAQLVGRKRWFLFPPSSTDSMYPTRIPYEESSVFSLVDVKRPDLERYPKFEGAEVHVVTLEPGDVLLVPHQWWHFVESLQTSISVNCWAELGGKDNEARLEEAVTRAVVSAFMGVYDPLDNRWLNPTEEEVDPEVNLKYVKESLLQCIDDERGSGAACHRDAVEGSSHPQPHPEPLSMDAGDEEPEGKRKRVVSRDQKLMDESTFTVHPTDWKDYARLLGRSVEGLRGRPTTDPCQSIITKRSIIDSDSQLRTALLNSLLHPVVIKRTCDILKQQVSHGH